MQAHTVSSLRLTALRYRDGVRDPYAPPADAGDPDAYAPFWADRRLRRIVLVTGLPMLFVKFPFGALAYVILTWFAGGFRCPRCKQRFAKRRLSLLLGSRCARCGLAGGSPRDLAEPPMFPALRSGNRDPLAEPEARTGDGVDT